MKAAETRVDRFLASSETAFAIPVYQRNYDWTRVQCQQLLNDILAIGADESKRCLCPIESSLAVVEPVRGRLMGADFDRSMSSPGTP